MQQRGAAEFCDAGRPSDSLAKGIRDVMPASLQPRYVVVGGATRLARELPYCIRRHWDVGGAGGSGLELEACRQSHPSGMLGGRSHQQ
jgi:hypothetical protein